MTVSYYLLILIYRKPFLRHFDCCHRGESFCKATFASITLAMSLLNEQSDNIGSDHGWVKWSIKCRLWGLELSSVYVCIYSVNGVVRQRVTVKWPMGQQRWQRYTGIWRWHIFWHWVRFWYCTKVMLWAFTYCKDPRRMAATFQGSVGSRGLCQ